MTDEQKKLVNKLVKEISKNNKESLEKLYTLMYRVLFCFLRNNCNNDSMIEDVINETFIVVINKSKKLIYKNCYSWILSISKNILNNYLRKYNNLNVSEPYNDDISNEYYTFDFNVELQQCISKLDKQSQEIIYLKYYAGLTNVEIAKILKISLSTVKRKVNLSLNILKGEINE